MVEYKGEKIYCIDASVVIDMVHDYPEWLIPGIWDAMAELADQDRLIIPKRVRDECKDDEVQQWFEDHSQMVKEFSEIQNVALTQLMADLDSDDQHLVDQDSPGKDEGDPFFIALIMAENKRLTGSYQSGPVTALCHEGASNRTRGKVKIKDVCQRYRINYLKLLDIAKNEGWRFVRG